MITQTERTTNIKTLGPVLYGTLVTPNLAEVMEAYVTYMHMTLVEKGTIGEGLADFWRVPRRLSGNSYAVLANVRGDPWLRIVEDPDCAEREPLKHTGWLALEVLVENVDELAATLDNSPFEILRPPADLDLTDKIRACQVKGPAGEILYLTQIKERPIPPFDLPMAQCAVDHLFIPVLASHDRATSLDFYEKIAGKKGLCFDTKITVINQAYGYPLDRKHPVATLQLSGECLIEIDELADAAPHKEEGLPPGIAMMAFEVSKLDPALPFANCAGTHIAFLMGPDGERLELVQKRGH